MSDRLLFIGWSAPVRGRERRSLEVFNEAMAICGRLQQEGRIDRFAVVLLEPNGDLGGYIEVHGTAEQLAAVREDPDFQRNLIDASLNVEGMRHIDGYAGEGVARQMALYQERLAKVPQMA